MNHRAVYDALIARAAGRVLTEYCEGHHIIPRSLGGNNAKSNIVKLTYREHFLAHWLLIKFTKGRTRRRMMHALTRMAQCHSGRIIAGWQYEVAKRAKVVGTKAQWADPEAKIRTPWHPERRAKMSAASKAAWASPEYRAKIGAATKAAWADGAHSKHSTAMKAAWARGVYSKQSTLDDGVGIAAANSGH